MMNLSQYDLWLFDCDGVILQSNQIKSKTMYQVALHLSDENTAQIFQQYHKENAGFTRFKKFTYFLKRYCIANQLTDDNAEITMHITPNSGSGEANLDFTYQYKRRSSLVRALAESK